MIKRFICLLLCLSLVAAWPLTALAQEKKDILHIRDLEDFRIFAENCILDSYSRGMTVYLHCDLDLTGTEFRGIPTFGGTFEGQNHSITGLELTEKGSAVGLFRYLQTTAIVRDLAVSGLVSPDGSASVVGGIVGSNRGVLQNCSFEGSVCGTSNTGGIAGINEAQGCIINCVSRGVVVGNNMTGGIAGSNLGLLEGCENYACVNIHSVDESVDISNIDLGVLMDPSSLSSGITVMDTGGIVGYCIGAVYDCKNYASIGYPHIGYNVGGIAGRSCGMISGCSNEARIQGRKDVGGIVGQMEPNVSLNLHEDYVQAMEQQLTQLEELTLQLQDSFTRLGTVHDHLNTALDHVNGASASLESLEGYISDYGNAVTDEVNRASLIVDEVLDDMVPVLEQATALGKSLSSAMDQMAEAMDAFAVASDYLGASLGAVNHATRHLKEAGETAAQATALITQGLRSLAQVLQVEDPQQLQVAMNQIVLGISQLADAAVQARDAVQKIADVMQQEGTWDDSVAEAFGEVTLALGSMAQALQSMADGAAGLSGNISFSSPDFWNGIDSIEQGMQALSVAAQSLSTAMDHLSAAMLIMEAAVEAGGDALRILADAMEEFGESFQLITQITQQLETTMDRLSHYEPFQLPYLDNGATEAVDLLFMNINGISDELRSIVSLSETFSQEATQCLTAMTDTFSQLIRTAMKLVNQVMDETANGVINDTSDVDIDAVKAGKVHGCVNTGPISGDISVGGITGAMAIEYTLDPEDDVSAELSNWQVRTYQAKAIVQECTNLGKITGKRNYMGGIAGKMDMGIILQSLNFGDVSSAEGGFVGGIAGDAGSIIRQCGVKANLSGTSYVGGVAGLGTGVTDCYVMVWLTGGEKTGAVLGFAEEVIPEHIAGNFYFYIVGIPGAIDGISYDGCAQAAQEDVFLKMEGLDSRFPEATITFCYEDGMVQVLQLPVGTVLDSSMIPVLENTDQQILFWKDLEAYLGKAVYFDWVFTVERKPMTAVLESVQTRPDGKPLVLLQGSFCTDDPVQLQPIMDLSGALEGWSFQLPADGKLTQIRYACPEGKNAQDLQIFVQGSDGAYREVSPVISGSYLVFPVEEGTTCFYVAELQREGIPVLWLALGGGALAAVVVTVILLCCRKKTSSRRKPKAATESKTT